jgi:hypothetical protein
MFAFGPHFRGLAHQNTTQTFPTSHSPYPHGQSVDFSIGPSFRHIETFQSTNQLIAVVLATNDLDAHAKFEHWNLPHISPVIKSNIKCGNQRNMNRAWSSLSRKRITLLQSVVEMNWKRSWGCKFEPEDMAPENYEQEPFTS